MAAWLTIAIVSLLASALFSGTEMAFITADRIRAELDMKRGGVVGRIMNRFYSKPEFFLSTILVGNNIMLVVYGIGAAILFEPVLQRLCDNRFVVLLLQTLVSTIVILLIGEFFPKLTFRNKPNTFLKVAAIPIFLFYVILYPVSLFATWLSKVLMRLLGIKNAQTRTGIFSIRELNQYLDKNIDDNEKEKNEVENEVKIFNNALDFSSTKLSDCMLPRNEIVAVNYDTATAEELSNLFTSSGRSKIIVYKNDIDNILGYIHVSELFDQSHDWKKRLKPVLFAPETLLAKKMMRRLLSEKKSLAVVIDEFGGTAGLVTLEDLVEEIFGDIQDEHDYSHLIDREIAPGVFEFSGRIEIAYLNKTYHFGLAEEDEYQTLAGYILFKTGSLPEKGEILELDGFKFEIVKKTETKLELIRVSSLEKRD